LNTVKKLQDLSRNRPWLTFLVLVTLGTMILFFLGCGSGSTPGSGKKEKAAKSSAGSTPAASLLTGKEGSAPQEVQANRGSQRIEVVPGFTQEELNAKHAEQRKKFAGANIEVAPGLTQKELESRHAEQRKKFLAPDMEVSPGVTQAELEARHGEQRKKFAAASDVINKEELNAKMRQRGKPQGQEWFPPSEGK
jgi:hypothetical protein